MDKQKKEQLILLIAVVIFVIMIPRFVFKKKPAAATPFGPGVIDKAAPAPQPAASQQVQPEANISENFEIISKDPFEIPVDVLEKLNAVKNKEIPQGLGGESEQITGVNIQGFTWGGDSPVAFINDKVYKKGDVVGEAQILDIDQKGVYFLYNGKRVLMRVKK